jgi:hypothetical protein
MRLPPGWEIRERICLQDVLWRRPSIRSTHIPECHLARLRGPAVGAYGICAGQRGHGPIVQAATGAREPAWVMYTPALQPYSEARDQAVAASRLLLGRKSTSMLKPLKTGTDLLR